MPPWTTGNLACKFLQKTTQTRLIMPPSTTGNLACKFLQKTTQTRLIMPPSTTGNLACKFLQKTTQTRLIMPPWTTGNLACKFLQTTRHIVEECPLTAFPGGLRRLHEAGPDAVEWLSRLSMKLWECSKQTTTTTESIGLGLIRRSTIFVTKTWVSFLIYEILIDECLLDECT